MIKMLKSAKKMLILIITGMLLISSCQNNSPNKKNENKSSENTNSYYVMPREISFTIVEKIPHDKKAYTQGLIFFDNFLFESTGQYGQSTIRKVNPTTGEVVQKERLPNLYFGEGIAIADNLIYMLTWQSQLCMVIDLKNFEVKETFAYSGEGWGLTFDGNYLIMSDGSNILKFIDRETKKIVKTLQVIYNNSPVSMLNELEMIDGKIWANIYMEDRIVIINPESGNVEQLVDFSNLRSNEKNNFDAEVLNGIAYDKNGGFIYLTGKYWANYYKIKIN